jgi:UDP-N-acetylglucosamine 2-epimerase
MILIVYGTRPEWIKIRPLISQFKLENKKYVSLFIGQHSTMPFIEITNSLDIVEMKNVDRLSSINLQILEKFSEHLVGIEHIENEKITHILIQGDTTSALSVAMAAYYNKRKIIHLEAGLRTYDHSNPYPEEANRQLISRIADIHFCPTIDNLKNLENEKVGGKKYVVGNTGLDNLLSIQKEIELEYSMSNITQYNKEILVTLHRRENHELISEWFTTINNLAKKYSNYKFILPIHPNPNVQKHKDILTNVNIQILEPLRHEKLIEYLLNSELIISDSGGLQEESSFFGKKMIVCRKTTERPEALGKTSFLCPTPNDLENLVDIHLNEYIANSSECPFGDGHASEKIVKILQEEGII